MTHLLKKRNVIGYVEDGKELKVFVTKKLPLKKLDKKDVVPKVIGFFKLRRTDVIEIGEVKALIDRKKYRPIQGGCEIGRPGVSSVGTGGVIVRFKKFRNLYLIGRWHSFLRLLESFGLQTEIKYGLLTNAHVTQRDVLIPEREKIVQPGGGFNNIGSTIYNTIIKKDADNQLDASLIELEKDVDLKIIQVGEVNGYKPVSKGEYVKKYGRTTKYTEGQCTAKNVTMTINYGSPAGTLRFKGLDMYSKMSDSGDSGSLIVSKADNEAVSLLFAGGPNTTFGIPIVKIVNKIRFSFV